MNLVQLIKNSKINKRIISIKRKFIDELYEIKDPWVFFMSQVAKSEFNRIDVVVRYLAIEDYFEKNEIGYALYKKMQSERDPESDTDLYLEKFKSLIKSFEKQGFDLKHPITVNKKNELVDGSHRLACALYFDVKKIKIKRSEVLESNYGMGWFEKHFTDQEVTVIKDKFRKLVTDIDLESKLINNLHTKEQQFGRGDLYQSCDELSISGQRPTTERYNIYGLNKILKPEYNVLDIGCNCGFFALEAARNVNSVTGLEINRVLVDIGKATQTHLDRWNCSFKQGDFNQFTSTDKFDVIFSFAVHHWVGGRIEDFGDKLYKLLNANGRVVFESQNLETVDKDFDEKIRKICASGFEQEEEGSLKDDGIIARKFVILRKIEN